MQSNHQRVSERRIAYLLLILFVCVQENVEFTTIRAEEQSSEMRETRQASFGSTQRLATNQTRVSCQNVFLIF